MRFTSSTLLALSTAAAGVAASPFKFPLPDGFPNPNPAQLAVIQKEAQGTLPNGPLPTILKSAGVTTLQLLAVNELFEVAYFTQLLANVTNDVPGYTAKSIAPLDKKYVVDSLTAVVNVRPVDGALEDFPSLTRITAREIARSGRKRNSHKRQRNRHQTL